MTLQQIILIGCNLNMGGMLFYQQDKVEII